MHSVGWAGVSVDKDVTEVNALFGTTVEKWVRESLRSIQLARLST